MAGAGVVCKAARFILRGAAFHGGSERLDTPAETFDSINMGGVADKSVSGRIGTRPARPSDLERMVIVTSQARFPRRAAPKCRFALGGTLLVLASVSLFGLDPQRGLTQFGLDVWQRRQGLPESSISAIAP